MEKITEFKKGHFWLSNFSPANVILDGITYRTVEHAYMSAKSSDPNWKAFCRDTYLPGKVKTESNKIEIAPYWNDDYRKKIMFKCLLQKFLQQPYKTMILYTGDMELEEGNTWGDRFWGVDLKTGQGENNLGKMIMDIRDRVKKHELVRPKESLEVSLYNFPILKKFCIDENNLFTFVSENFNDFVKENCLSKSEMLTSFSINKVLNKLFMLNYNLFKDIGEVA